MSTIRKRFYSPEEYLELERNAEYPSEYLSGQVFSVAEPEREHSWIMAHISGNIYERIEGRGCDAFLNVQIQAPGLYAYPDVVVLNAEAIPTDSDPKIVHDPIMIFEVVSPSTETYDRGLKFEHYRRLESLTDYVLVWQKKILVEHYAKQPNGDWLLHTIDDPKDAITFTPLNFSFPLDRIYYWVHFDDEARQEI